MVGNDLRVVLDPQWNLDHPGVERFGTVPEDDPVEYKNKVVVTNDGCGGHIDWGMHQGVGRGRDPQAEKSNQSQDGERSAQRHRTVMRRSSARRNVSEKIARSAAIALPTSARTGSSCWSP
jgi:hypothetical protein